LIVIRSIVQAKEPPYEWESDTRLEHIVLMLALIGPVSFFMLKAKDCVAFA